MEKLTRNDMENKTKTIIEWGIKGWYKGCTTAVWSEHIFLDPKFFEAIGRACGWKTKMGHCGKDADDFDSSDKTCCHFGSQECEWFVEGWKYHYLKFHEVNADTLSLDSAIDYLYGLLPVSIKR